jgi:hypothetical protein
MENKDEYLVYTSQNNDTFYFKNRKLHRENGPAIVCRKDKNKETSQVYMMNLFIHEYLNQ